MGKHDKLGYRLGLILTRLNNGESLAVRELSENLTFAKKLSVVILLSACPILI